MRDVYSISGPSLQALLAGLRQSPNIDELRLGVTDAGVQFQSNGFAWTPPLGQRVPRAAATGEILTARTVM